MKIAIFGSGNVGAALGIRWSALGHSIVFGSREPNSEKIQKILQTAGPTVRAVDIGAAAQGADVVLLATPFTAARETLMHAGSLAGRVLIDATNPFAAGMRLQTWPESSAAEQVAAWAPGARLVKAFNMTGSGNMSQADYGAVKPAMFYCGDDMGAKAIVHDLSDALGFDPVDCGPLSTARYLEPLAGLWVSLAYMQGMGPNIAFALLRR